LRGSGRSCAELAVLARPLRQGHVESPGASTAAGLSRFPHFASSGDPVWLPLPVVAEDHRCQACAIGEDGVETVGGCIVGDGE
jgi:hypothetical protein